MNEALVNANIFYNEGNMKFEMHVSFTLLSLEAVAPFVVRYQTVLVRVTRIEERLGALFILIKIYAPKL